jgi:hypothetical protein
LENTISKAPSVVIVYVLWLCYGLWYARNKICFERRNIEALNIVRKAWNIIEDHKGLKNTQVDGEPTISISSPSTWTPPPTSSFKLNIDASGPVDNKWGVGAIVRDAEGFVLAAATWNFEALPDATIAEALGFRLAIQFAYDMGFRNIIVEGDHLNVVKALKSHSDDNFYFGLVIDDCKSLSCLFSSFLVSHVRRVGNAAAHALVKFTLDSTDSVWIEEIPSCIVLLSQSI